MRGKMKLKEYIDKDKTYIIAEMSANHAGDKNRAIEIIHAAKEAGADCIKIQTYTPDTLTIDCDNQFFHIDDGTWKGDTLYNLYKKAYTPWEWQEDLKKEADSIGIDFLSTPFDKSSVDFLENLKVEFYKIASFELVDIPLIEYVASKKKPIILSTGMGSVEEIQEAVDTIRKYHNDIVLLKCSSSYPAIMSQMNLKTMVDMKERFRCPIGISDHSMGVATAIVAVSLGAKVVEKHFCISRDIENPDSSFSMERKEFLNMAKEIRNAEKALGKIEYGVTSEERSSVIFRKSIFAVKDIAEGEKITDENIRVIRPGYGLKPKYYNEILGKTAARDIQRGYPIEFEVLKEG